ncbi:uncharacterized protein LOC101462477 [Ceratitis capitata]|uniref:(Mediterranean fruit fly) hypothetical protein n=1 Tax=Ceratitis capitata TaxID=7213 RepID=A0A811U629_CERCA|nr:uncharacterized protein LOC101462477 [Ceratitis capitata]CAD6993900.1 unnamed protein product [Ceratitis capitata]
MRLGYSYFILLCQINVFWITHTVGNPINFQNVPNGIYKKLLSLRTLPFEDCGSQYDVLYVGVSNCSSIPCQMVRGSTVVVKVFFDDNGDQTSYLKHRVRWIFNAIKTNALITPDPCDDDQHCLIDESDGKSYNAQVFVTSTLPNIRGTMMWVAENAKNEEVICFKIPIIITTA